MRLGRRLSAGIAEDPPAPVPAEVGTPEPVAREAGPAVGTGSTVGPGPAVEPRRADPITTGG